VKLVPIRTDLYTVCSLLFFSSQSDITNSYREVISFAVNTCAQIDLAQCCPNTAAECTQSVRWTLVQSCDCRGWSM